MSTTGLFQQLLGVAQQPTPKTPLASQLMDLAGRRDNNRQSRADYHAGRNTGPTYPEMWDVMHPMDKAALATAPVPGVGDVVGLAADARALYEEPSWTNAGMMALGAIPLVPAAGVLKRGVDAADTASEAQSLGRALQETPGAGPIRAYHGSPHDFDKFSLDKIGTGEGAQAYGHGLYFAENEGVAQSYRDALKGRRGGVVVDGVPHDAPKSLEPGLAAEYRAPLFARGALDEGNTLEHEARRVRALARQARNSPERITGFQREGGWADADELERTADILDDWANRNLSLTDTMYEVNINANPDDFLDWDAPLRDRDRAQLGVPAEYKSVRSALDFLGEQRIIPENQVFSRDEAAQAAQAASQAASERGVPGIKYLDQGSRGAGEGSRNYVVFDENLISIVRKYGIAGVMAMPGGAAMLRDYEERNGPMDDQL